MTLWLSRLTLKDAAGFGRLGPVLFPDDPGARAGASHRLVWTLFPETLPTRPFLYRETAPGRAGHAAIHVLSTLRPEDRLGLFALETQPFEPMLAPGDRLAFALRANPAVNRRDGDGRNRRHDVVMDALIAVPREERAEARPRLVREAGARWLAAEGERSGFRLADPETRLTMDGYGQVAIERGGGRTGRIRLSTLDLSGELEVSDPARFLARMAEGFGRARAFGCGLMLIRRA